MKKKGFTLIELLAVIVILAVIALISMPLVLNTIDESRRSAANESANSYVSAVETAIVSDMINSNYTYDGQKTFNIINKGKIIKNNDKELEININGIYPSDGYVVIKDGIVIRGLVKINGYNINYEIANRCEIGETWNFDYTGSEQLFTVPCKGVYKLETWGAQGGGYSGSGGYGGYSVGNVELNTKSILYISSGESGKSSYQKSLDGTFNGGGTSEYQSGFVRYFSSGGGATHIATKSGLLSTLSNSISSILIVSGGGGGGGFYGGGSSNHVQGAGGGSGYIGNTSLTNKVMYCYECEESNDTSTKTISTTCMNESPVENCAKEGNGYARITLVAISN